MGLNILERFCRRNHSDHWDYMDETKYWCPICRQERKPLKHRASDT